VSIAPSSYPFALEIDGPAKQGRLSILLRYFYAIPFFIALGFLQLGAAIVGFVAFFVILFTGKYPPSLRAFATDVVRWQIRGAAYTMLLTGAYPPFAMGDVEDYPIRLIGEGQLEGRNRLTTLFRYIIIIPHLVVLFFIAMVGFFLLFFGWLAAIFTGSLPEAIHNFLAGQLRWTERVTTYAALLTDDFPPFSMK